MPAAPGDCGVLDLSHMGWRDRDYARGARGGFSDNPLMWLFSGRVFLFRVWNVDVFLHASLVVVSALVLIFGTPFGATPLDRLAFVVILFGSVLLHEFGHIWGARVSGGSASEVLLTPLGGLAMTQPGKGPRPAIITTACGPAVTLLIALTCGLGLWLLTGYAQIGPYAIGRWSEPPGWSTPGWFNLPFWLFYVYSLNYYLLLFNLLPVYPLDGGRLLQEALWFKLGYYRSTLLATAVGMVGSVLMALYGLASGSLLLLFIGASCFFNCWQIHRMMKAEGPWAFGEEDEPDWSKSANMDPDEPEKVGFFETRRREKVARRAENEAVDAARAERQVDEVLAKVGKSGMASLTAAERRVLERATAARRGR